jgi:hypothetical protein
MSTGDDTEVRGPSAEAQPQTTTPAPPLDAGAVTPDRDQPGSDEGPAQAASGAGDEHPEFLVAGAFVGGLAAALLLKRAADG